MTIALIRSYTDKPWRSPETFDLIEAALAERWRVVSVRAEDPAALARLLAEAGPDVFAFNISEYLDEKTKFGFLPTLLDGMGIPRLGSSAETVAVALDKAGTKRALSARGIPTPAFFTADRADDNLLRRAEGLGYPLFVKPVGEGGHIGIDADSIVRDAASLARAVERIVGGLRQSALVEKYVSEEGMREFSVGVLDGPDRLFTPIEIDWAAMDVPAAILSHEVAVGDLERVKPIEDEEARSAAIDLASRSFDALGARDYARIDIRMNDSGWYVLELNAMPGLGPHSFLPEAAESLHGIGYPQLIRKLAEDSLRRQGML